MFIDGVNSMDVTAAELSMTAGNAAFWYHWSGWVGSYRGGYFSELDLSFVNPLRSVEDETVRRQLPGGTGFATDIYSRIAPEREELANAILDFFTTDEMVALRNAVFSDAVSTNIGVQPSDDPLAIRYGEISAPNQFVYLDWYWPPEITRSPSRNSNKGLSLRQSPRAKPPRPSSLFWMNCAPKATNSSSSHIASN